MCKVDDWHHAFDFRKVVDGDKWKPQTNQAWAFHGRRGRLEEHATGTCLKARRYGYGRSSHGYSGWRARKS